jgi:NADH-quinone oxidoreductase subunit N
MLMALVPATARARSWGRRLGLAIAWLALLVAAWRVASEGAGHAGVLLWDGQLVADPLSELADLVISALTLAALVIFGSSSRADAPARGALVMLASLGAMVVGHAVDLLTIVCGLELAGLAVAALIGGRARGGRLDPGTRWLLAHGLSAAILLMGLALIYGATGTLDLLRLSARLTALFTGWAAGNVQKAVEILQLPQLPIGGDAVLHLRDAAVKGTAPAAFFILGLLLTLAGLLSRLGVWLLHRGVPAVYASAEAGALVLCDSVLRLAGALALIRVLPGTLNTARLVYAPYGWTVPLATFALLTFIVPALALARGRVDLRRLLGWGALYHGGWILLGVIAAGDFYAHAGLRPGGLLVGNSHEWGMLSGDRVVAGVLLVAVAVALAGAGVLAAAVALGESRALTERELDDRNERTDLPSEGAAWLRGAFHRQPWTAGALALCLLSWASALPLTAGFAGRAALVMSALADSNPMVRALVVVGLLGGLVIALGVVRVLRVMLEPAEAGVNEALERPSRRRGDAAVAAVAVVAALLSLVLGSGGLRVWNPFVRATAASSLPLAAETRALWVKQALATPDTRDE